MSLLKKYACMYGDIEFTPEEEEELGRFAARLMKTADDDVGMVDLFSKEFGDLDAESFCRINNYLEWVEINETGEKRAAAKMGPIMHGIGKVIGPLSLALAASPLIGHAIKSFSKSSDLKKSLKKIYQNHPELKSDPHVKDYFQAIADFAPTVAKNPLVAGNVLVQMHKVGPGFVTPQLIRELIGIQGQTGTTRFGTPSTAAAEMSKPTMDLAKFMTEKYNLKR